MKNYKNNKTSVSLIKYILDRHVVQGGKDPDTIVVTVEHPSVLIEIPFVKVCIIYVQMYDNTMPYMFSKRYNQRKRTLS